jgi:hypothetical protein
MIEKTVVMVMDHQNRLGADLETLETEIQDRTAPSKGPPLLQRQALRIDHPIVSRNEIGMIYSGPRI